MSLEIDVLKIDIDALTEVMMNREAELVAATAGTASGHPRASSLSPSNHNTAYIEIESLKEAMKASEAENRSLPSPRTPQQKQKKERRKKYTEEVERLQRDWCMIVAELQASRERESFTEGLLVASQIESKVRPV